MICTAYHNIDMHIMESFQSFNRRQPDLTIPRICLGRGVDWIVVERAFVKSKTKTLMILASTSTMHSSKLLWIDLNFLISRSLYQRSNTPGTCLNTWSYLNHTIWSTIRRYWFQTPWSFINPSKIMLIGSVGTNISLLRSCIYWPLGKWKFGLSDLFGQ